MRSIVLIAIAIVVAAFWGFAIWWAAHQLSWWTFELAYFGFFILYGMVNGTIKELRKR